MPCHLTECLCKSNQERIVCKHFAPSRNSRLAKCDYYYQYRMDCPKKDAGKYPATCQGCEYHDSGGVGRPNKTGVDWSDPTQVKEYKRQQRASQSDTGVDSKDL